MRRSDNRRERQHAATHRGWIVLMLWMLDPGCTLERYGRRDVADASLSDGCRPMAEQCNRRDDDCDGDTDEGFDLTTVSRCGACDTVCPDGANASPRCVGGRCSLECDPGFADCNDDPDDGCEADINHPTTCGACDRVCSEPTPLCQDDGGGTFSCVSSCESGRTRCGDSCVDTDRSLQHCGACDDPCVGPPNGTPTCMDGMCRISMCSSGFDDCDGDFSNGCETALTTNANCGGCGVPCTRPNASASCATGMCRISICQSGFGDCDGDDANGCENTLDSLADCGECGRGCAPPNATANCAGDVCAISACDADRDDCNMDISDGCEADLTRDVTCGSCENACSRSEECAAGSCQSLCSGSCVATCSQTCDNSSACSCEGGCFCHLACDQDCDLTQQRCRGTATTCAVDVAPGVDANLRCDSGATCTVDAADTDDIVVQCQNAGTSCEIDCTNASSCAVTCNGGAQCIMQCAGSGSCGYSSCSAGREQTCPGGVIVCNRSCP